MPKKSDEHVPLHRKYMDFGRLTELTKGATIRSFVEPRKSDPEGIFVLKLLKDGKKFDLCVSAGELGWDYETAGNTS